MATGRRLAALTVVAVRVFEEICTLAWLNRGHAFPSYDWLVEATGLGRATIARGLMLLEAAGFPCPPAPLRTRRQGGGGGRGHRRRPPALSPDLQRLSRALAGERARLSAALATPGAAARRPDPARGDRREETTAMLATLSCRDLAKARVAGALGRVLTRPDARIDAACEFQTTRNL